MNRSLELLYNILEEKLPPNYPQVDLPATLKDAARLYKEFNKRYFDNSLPTSIKFKVSKSAKGFLGRTKYTLKGNKASDFSITIASKVTNSNMQFIDTLLHEMIHVWQASQSSKHDDPKFRDRGPDSDIKGHGKYFTQEQSKLNALGFNINKTHKGFVEIDSIKDIYGLIAFTKDNKGLSVIHSDVDFKDKIDGIISDLESKIGTFIDNYVYFTTKDSSLTAAITLTKAGKIPKNLKHMYYKDTFATRLLTHDSTKVLLKKTIQKSSSGNAVPESIKVGIAFVPKYLPYSRWVSEVVRHAGKDFPNVKVPSGIVAGQMIPDLPQHINDILLDGWKKATKPELKRSVSSQASSILLDIVTKSVSADKVNSYVLKAVDTNKGRLSAPEVYKLIRQVVEELFSKKTRIKDKTGVRVLLSQKLAGTLLEAMTASTRIIKLSEECKGRE